MPITPTYPGVYIEELPSGVRTITGVATSITAFLGRALRGPVDEPVFINSFGDFERVFGGLWVDNSLGFAVRDFYLNGGSQAIVVRLFHAGAARDAAQDVARAAADEANLGPATPASVAAAALTEANKPANANPPRQAAAAAIVTAANTERDRVGAPAPTAASVSAAAAAAVDTAAPVERATFDVAGGSATNKIALVAASEGSWGNNLRARVDYNVAGGAANLFNLSIKDTRTGDLEVHRNLSVEAAHPRRVDRVLENESNLARISGTLPAARPDAHDAGVGKDVWGDNTPETSDKVANAVSNGGPLELLDFLGTGFRNTKRGLYALLKADLFNILCIPPYNASGDADKDLLDDAAAFCEERRAFLLIDPPASWNSKDNAKSKLATDINVTSKNAAIYFPRLLQPNILREGQIEAFAPCGVVAGVMARTDAQRGVWKAPAGLDARLVNVPQLSVRLTDEENGELNPLGINCLRTFPAAGSVVWGARTLQGDDRLASEWKYVPVRRVALFIEESLYRGTQWVVFEPNDEPLWAQIRLNIGAFMHNLFRQGAFQGTTPQEAYFVKCDKETTTQNDINLGIVNIVVGFAPLKPAEFVIIKIQQIAGRIEV